MEELDQLEDVITNMFMADSIERLNEFTIIGIYLIIRIKEKLLKGGKHG